jgi:hypothetical protein
VRTKFCGVHATRALLRVSLLDNREKRPAGPTAVQIPPGTEYMLLSGSCKGSLTKNFIATCSDYRARAKPEWLIEF